MTSRQGTGRCRGPRCEFPAELSALALVELQVLRSRVVRRLEPEYLVDAGGRHPVTQDRHEGLVAEPAERARSAPGR